MTSRTIFAALVVATLALGVLSSATAVSQEGAAADVYVAVERVPHMGTISADGHILALERKGQKIHPEVYRGNWIVREVIETGALVSEGQVILCFETEDIERQIVDARFEFENAMISFRHQQENVRLADESTVDDFRRAERDLENARLRLEGWVKHQLEFARRDAALNLESWTMSVDNLREEFAELQKMYDEDELVEATEELVLRRTKRSLAQRLGTFELVMARRAYEVEFEESRRAEQLEMDLRLKEQSFARRRISAEMAARDRKTGLERTKRSIEKQERGLAKLRKDLDSMSVKASISGVVLHGSDVTDTKKIEPGQRLSPSSPFLTIVAPLDLTAKFQVPAAKLLKVKVGQAFTLTPKVDGAAALTGEVNRISMFATNDQKVTLLGRIRLEKPSPGAIGGVAGSVKLETGLEQVLVVPEAAVQKGVELLGVSIEKDKDYCRVKGQDAHRQVKLGEKIGDRVIVIEGLAEGDEVLVPGTKK
jgi:HlyD family secretion protein